jgi:hypothetical protein
MVMKRFLALILSVLLAAPGCAATIARQTRDSGARNPSAPDPALMSDYIRQLPVGSRVRVTLASGKVIRATLMKRDADPIVVQRRTRIPEPPFEISVREILAMELDTPNGSVGRNIAVGAAAAAGVTLGVLVLLAAIFSD